LVNLILFFKSFFIISFARRLEVTLRPGAASLISAI